MICRSSRCRSKTGNYRETLLDRLSTHPGSRSAARGSRWSVSSAVSPGLSGGKTTLDLGQEDLQKLLGRVVHAATLVLGHMALDLDLEHRRMMPELFPSATGFGDPLVIEEEAVMDLLAPSDPLGEHLGAEEGGETGNWAHHGRLHRSKSGRRIADLGRVHGNFAGTTKKDEKDQAYPGCLVGIGPDEVIRAAGDPCNLRVESGLGTLARLPVAQFIRQLPEGKGRYVALLQRRAEPRVLPGPRPTRGPKRR